MKTTMTSARAAGKAAATSARKVQVLRTATTMSARRVGSSTGGRAKTLKHNAGVTEMETDNGTCYGSFCYNFEFENVSRDAPNREREREREKREDPAEGLRRQGCWSFPMP